MMFDKLTVSKIIKRRKTVTRRLRKNDKSPAKIGNIHKLKIDRTPKGYGYIQIENVYPSTFGELTLTDALKEGFDSIQEYQKYFLKVNGTIHPNTPIWVVEFKYIGGTING